MARRRGRSGTVRRSLGNWLIGGTAFNSGGGPFSGTSWGQSYTVVASASPVTLSLVSSAEYTPGTASSVADAPGEFDVDVVEGTINFSNPVGAVVGVCVGIYLARQLPAASTSVAVQDPSNPADARHDDYLFLKGFTLQGTSATANTSPISMSVSIPRQVYVPSGSILVCTVACAAGTVTIVPFIRSHVRRSV